MYWMLQYICSDGPAVLRPGGTQAVGGLSERHENTRFSLCFSRSGGIKDCKSKSLSPCIYLGK